VKDFMLCLSNVGFLVGGQLLFKRGVSGREISSLPDVVKLMFKPSIIVAIILYAGATLLWIYILTRIPISYAYPIQALAFPLVVVCSFFLFKEAVPIQRWIGLGIIVLGAFIASR